MAPSLSGIGESPPRLSSFHPACLHNIDINTSSIVGLAEWRTRGGWQHALS